jgi:glycosyltransferase involved in cell wall biosynthesis
MHILMLAPQPFFEPRGTPFSVLGRLKVLSQLGHTVDLLTYHIGQSVNIPGVTILRTPMIRWIRKVPIGPSRTKLFLDIFLFLKAFRLLCNNRYDLLHTHEEASIFGLAFAKLFRLRHLYDMHSSLPQQLQNFRYTGCHSLIRLVGWLERLVLSQSDAVITICPALAEHVERLNRHAPQVMIENTESIDLQAVSTEETAAFKATYTLGGAKIVLYTGTFEPYQGLDLLIASAKQVLCQTQDVVFLLVGGSQEQVRYYQERVRQGGCAAHFRFTGTLPPAEMPCIMQLASVLVSPRVCGTNTPLKIYSYLQSGKPIVATNLPTHTQVLHKEVAVLVAPEPDAFAQGILSVLADPQHGTCLGHAAQQFFAERYSAQTCLQKTAQALALAMR